MGTRPPGTGKPPRDKSRIIAGALAAALGLLLVISLGTGRMYTGRSVWRATITRSENAEMYWLLIALVGACIVVLAAAALGFLSWKIDNAEWSRRRARNQRDATIFGLLGWMAMVYIWFETYPQEGLTPAHAIFGLAIIGWLGVVALMAPAPTDEANKALKIGGGVIVAAAVLAAFLV